MKFGTGTTKSLMTGTSANKRKKKSALSNLTQWIEKGALAPFFNQNVS